jgi:hypothetical protein
MEARRIILGSHTRQDLVCAALIALACAMLWAPALDTVSLNPDESQYEATASYLAAQDRSAFLPNGAPGTFLLFKTMTRLAGPYPIGAMRTLTMLVALSIAWLLYVTVARASHRAAGLLSALVFLHLATRFEGFAVNREWFASILTMAGLALALRTIGAGRKRPGLMMGIAGFLCGAAIWFKLQVSVIVFVVPLTLLFEALRRRSVRGILGPLLPFAAGGIGAGVAYLLPFAVQGNLSEFLRFMFSDVSVFVEGNEVAIERDYLEQFYLGLPYGVLFVAGYVFAGSVLAFNLFGGKSKDDGAAWLRRPAVAAFAVYLPLAIYTVQLGQRFFRHYYQLMLPALAACIGLAAFGFTRLLRDRPVWRGVSLAFTVFFLVDRFLALRTEALWAGKVRWPEAFVVGLLALGCLAVTAYWLQYPLRRAGPALVALLVVQSSVLIVTEQLAPAPVSMQHNRHKFVDLTRLLEANAAPDDRLFVWGWAPEIYSLSRLESATHITFCQYVAGDLQGVADRPRLDRQWADLLMGELATTRPRFIVDAAAASWFETEADIYELDNFPEFELNTLLRENYREIGRADECAVWERTAEGP